MGEETRIYVADLAAYNNGILHGVWIDVTLELDDIWQQIKIMLKAISDRKCRRICDP